MSKHRFYCNVNDPNATLYIYEDGVWKGEQITRNILLHELSIMHEDATKRNTMNLERPLTWIRGQAMESTIPDKPPELIPFKNGFLVLKPTLVKCPTMSWEFKPMDMMELSGRYFYTNQIPWEYNADAKCPNFEKFISEVIKPEDIPLVQEMIGYCFYTHYSEPVFFVLTGKSGNGKTVLMTLLCDLLGNENTTSETMYNIVHNRFSAAELYRKLACITDDLGNEVINNTGMLKMLTGSSRITAENKFGKPFSFTSYAKLIFASNEPPEIIDPSEAIKNRIRVIEFPNVFKKEPNLEKGERPAKERKQLLAELESEMPGIIVWAIQGLKRLIDNDFRFSSSKSTDEMWELYRRKANPVAAFVQECLKYTGNEELHYSKEELYEKFKEYCLQKEIKSDISYIEFCGKLIDEGIKSRQLDRYNKQHLIIGYELCL